MNIMMNSAHLPASGEAAVPAVAGAAPLPLAGEPALDPLAADPLAAIAQPAAPLDFLQFLEVDAALPPVAEASVRPDADVVAQAAAPEGAAPAEVADESTAQSGEPLLAAMAMPLMPSMMAMQAVQAASMRIPVAQPEQAQQQQQEQKPAAVSAASSGLPEQAVRAVEIPAPAQAQVPLQMQAAVPAAAARQVLQALAPTPAPVQVPAQAAQTAPAGEQPRAVERRVDEAVPAALPAQAQVVQMDRGSARVQAAQPAPAAAVPQPANLPAAVAAREGASTDGQAAGNNGGNNGNNAGVFGVAAPAAPGAAPREAAATLVLAGPPTAWRQSLQDALGERLNLQLGRNAEQAVIRLEPPMLGRVEISIRHAAGSLEVNISATHSEVLRQLNTVSDNLRNDLAQRQYTDVSVNVTQAAPRAQAAQAGAGFGADAQGRGRQQGQDGDERAPGAALAEANQSTTPFSLNGRA
jgi:flagellar hook-length control protein FliK